MWGFDCLPFDWQAGQDCGSTYHTGLARLENDLVAYPHPDIKYLAYGGRVWVNGR